jgi:hypothetical protein
MSVQTANDTDSDYNAYEINPGMVFETENGERVEVASDDGPAGAPLVLHFPQREPQLDENGDTKDVHTQYRDRYSVARVATREGWSVVGRNDGQSGEGEEIQGGFNGPVPCPECGQYMKTFYDGERMPTALCTREGCQHNGMDAKELIEQGYYK